MIIVDGMWERKKILVDEGQAALALPGGYGTVDEVFEFLYWAQKGFHDKPIGLLNVDGYWSPLMDFLEAVYKAGELEKSVYERLIVEDDIDVLLDRLAKHNQGRDPAPLRGAKTHISKIEESNLMPTQNPVIIEDASIESLYRLANALVLKQLSKITRAIGVVDDDRLFAGLKLWIYTAATQRFITPYCPDMVVFADSRAALDAAIEHHIHVSVDLHEKWEGNHAKPHLVREHDPEQK
tara:strand:- start:167 stop:880 length:714 start_codon:yes stop_codon:yes gene_type:complete